MNIREKWASKISQSDWTLELCKRLNTASKRKLIKLIKKFLKEDK
jgi:hypothetical protein